jgi:hypothetical protein
MHLEISPYRIIFVTHLALFFLQAALIRFMVIPAIFLRSMPIMGAMTAVHKNMHQWAQEKDQKWERVKQMRTMLY